MKALFALLGLSTVLLGACAHERYARRECEDCHHRCKEDERICSERGERDCGGRHRACVDGCRANEWCR